MRQHDPKLQSSTPCNPSLGRWGDRPGDSWLCEGENATSCPHGPSPQGLCCNQGTNSPCQPLRRWTSFRRRLSFYALLLGTGFLFIAFGGSWRIDFFAPGPLTLSHAQLLGGELKNDRCAACHNIAGTSWVEWFGRGGKSHSGLTQNDLCIDCHHQRIPKQRSGLAHNLSAEELHALKNLSQQLQVPTSGVSTINVKQDFYTRPIKEENLACSNCHREHGGPLHDLTLMSSAACQACHQTKYSSFVEDHPDWNSWPSNSPGVISFDHKSHLAHFAKKETAFQCQQCQLPTANVTIAASTPLSRTHLSRTPDFQTACASCHESPINIQANEGFVLLQLPVLDNLALESTEAPLHFEWPESVQGAEPLSIPPLMEWFLNNRAASEDALRTLKSPYYKPWAQEPTNQQNQAVVTVASEIQSLLRELASRREEAVDSLPSYQMPSYHLIDTLFDHLPRQRLRIAIRHWLETDFKMQDTSELQNLAQEDSFEPLDPASLAPGWYRDDKNFKIGYRGTGHADVVLKTLCELVVDQQTDEALRKTLLAIPSVKSCLECHRNSDSFESLSLESSAKFQWFDQPKFETAQSLTKFSHTPHLNIQSLADCKHCHTMPLENRTLTSGPLVRSSQDPNSHYHSDFGIAGKQTCIACHRPEAAGDSCTQCHRYHAMFSALETQSSPQTSAPQLQEARRESPIQESSSEKVQR